MVPSAPVKYALLYETTDDFRSKVPLHIEAHRALWKQFHAAQTLLMVGPFTDGPVGGALAIFTTREAAEAFAKVDPFVSGGIVAHWTIREWHEVLAP
jgi:uncharacterized protein YciI